MKVAIVNYGVGNLASVARAVEDLGAEPLIANHAEQLSSCDAVILPGVGSFVAGMNGLRAAGWVEPLRQVAQQRPLLGICLGMQMLASVGHEGTPTEGLGLIPADVHRLDALGCDLRIPHVGWNDVRQMKDDEFFRGVEDATDFYFVHSYAMVLTDPEWLVATAHYGCDIVAAVRKGRIFGCQFHPEKSSAAGRQLLRNFLDLATC